MPDDIFQPTVEIITETNSVELFTDNYANEIYIDSVDLVEVIEPGIKGDKGDSVEGPPGIGIPPGGLPGDYLKKGPGGDYDAIWVTGGHAVKSVNGNYPNTQGNVTLKTDNVAEGTINKYFSNALAIAAVVGVLTGPLAYDSQANTIGILQASDTQDGYISAADYAAVMAKQNTINIPQGELMYGGSDGQPVSNSNLSWDDNNQALSISGYLNLNSGASSFASLPNGGFQLGDIYNAYNGTLIHADDYESHLQLTARNITLYGTSNYYNGWFNGDTDNHIFSWGDYSSTYNQTYIQIDDINQIIYFNAYGSYNFSGSTIYANLNGYVSGSADLNGNFNGNFSGDGGGLYNLPVSQTSPSGGEGAVQFNQYGNFTGDGYLYYDYNNHRLAIGTTTPSAYTLTLQSAFGQIGIDLRDSTYNTSRSKWYVDGGQNAWITNYYDFTFNSTYGSLYLISAYNINLKSKTVLFPQFTQGASDSASLVIGATSSGGVVSRVLLSPASNRQYYMQANGGNYEVGDTITGRFFYVEPSGYLSFDKITTIKFPSAGNLNLISDASGQNYITVQGGGHSILGFNHYGSLTISYNGVAQATLDSNNYFTLGTSTSLGKLKTSVIQTFGNVTGMNRTDSYFEIWGPSGSTLLDFRNDGVPRFLQGAQFQNVVDIYTGLNFYGGVIDVNRDTTNNPYIVPSSAGFSFVTPVNNKTPLSVSGGNAAPAAILSSTYTHLQMQYDSTHYTNHFVNSLGSYLIQPSNGVTLLGVNADPTLAFNSATGNSGSMRIAFAAYPGQVQYKAAIISTAQGSYGRAWLDFCVNGQNDNSIVALADSQMRVSEAGVRINTAIGIGNDPVANYLILTPSSGNQFNMVIASPLNNGKAVLYMSNAGSGTNGITAAIFATGAGSYGVTTGIQFAVTPNVATGGAVALDGTHTKMNVHGAGLALGAFFTPTAKVHFTGGGTAAGTGQTKYASGSLLTTPEAGVKEYDGSYWYGTNSAGVRRSFAWNPANAAYTIANDTASRSLDVSTVTLAQLANFIATVYKDLKAGNAIT